MRSKSSSSAPPTRRTRRREGLQPVAHRRVRREPPFPIVVIRTHDNDYIGYVNACPHDGVWLNIGSGDFFTPDRAFLKCGRHGATFEIDSGLGIDGPCQGKSLEPIALAVVDGEVCLCG